MTEPSSSELAQDYRGLCRPKAKGNGRTRFQRIPFLHPSTTAAAVRDLLAHLPVASLRLPQMAQVIGLGMAFTLSPKMGCPAGHLNKGRILFSSRSPRMARFMRLRTGAFLLLRRTERSDGNSLCRNPNTLPAGSRLATTELFTSQP